MTPAAGTQNVPPNTPITLTFSAPVSLQKAAPTLSPSIAGKWVQSNATTLTYELDSPLIPYTQEVVTIPGGAHGLTSKSGATLSSSHTVAFGVAAGDTLRLQQLLAQLDYLPVGFSPTGPAPTHADLALDQQGSFSWRWPSLPTQLTSQWTQGTMNEITKAAIENFENQNSIGVDGEAGPTVWTALLNDVINNKVSATPYVYVLVNKVVPQTATLWNNGTVQYTVPVNSGAPGADTTDGTYAVFEHVRFSEMKGTNVDGSTYDDPNVPYASYFNGGDALHGFIRSSYGTPQSNGCVEMSYANAALFWALTPIGTLVTVEGPDLGTAPPPTTTTTTAPGTTTTAPAAPAAPPAAVTTTTLAPAVTTGSTPAELTPCFGSALLGAGRPELGGGRRLGLGAPWRTGAALGAQAPQALRHVVGLGVGAEEALEVLPRLGDVARPLVQVRQQVPLADVPFRRVAQGLGRPRGRQHGDGAVEVAGVGQRGRRDDPALGQDVGLGRALPELGPQGGHLLGLVQRPLAVHQHRDVLGRVAQAPEGLEMPGGRTPPAGAVGGQPGQLAHGGHAGSLVGHGLDGPQRVGEAVALVGAEGRLGQMDQVLTVVGRGDVGGVADFRGDLRRQGVLVPE